jgi:hemolysin activation/secretion protein
LTVLKPYRAFPHSLALANLNRYPTTMSIYSSSLIATATIASLFLGAIGPVSAQGQPIQIKPVPNPNLDRIPQPQPLPSPLPTTQPPLITPPSPAPTPSEGPNVEIPVQKIEIVGSTVFKPADFKKLTQGIEGKTVQLKDLQDLTNKITALYLDRGYITSRAVLSEQAIVNGIVKIQIVEGSIERIEIEGLKRLQKHYVLSRVKLGVKTPLNKDQLEDQLQLLKSDTLLKSIEASLRPGKGLGQSILTLRVKESAPITASVGIDNYSSPSVGSERFGGSLTFRNVTGLGDRLSTSYNRSFAGGSNVFDFSYQVPINAMNGTLQFRAAPSRSKVVEAPFDTLDIRNETNLYEFSYRQPIIRSPREELALSLSFALQDDRTTLSGIPLTTASSGTDINGRGRTRVLKFGQDYLRRDPQGAWALQSQFNFGLDVLDATVSDTAQPDGRFFSWLGQVQRVQRLGKNQVLIAQADLQLSPDTLLPSQQFVIGGGQSLRGYRQNLRSGDNGFRFSVEDRIALVHGKEGRPVFQLAPFFDAGVVWNNPNNPLPLAKETFLASPGLGFIWEPVPRFVLRLDYAIPLIYNSDRKGNLQDNGLNFSVGYTF